jgi:alpha-glucosidase (family GH31 glycosyl hydrolase)
MYFVRDPEILQRWTEFSAFGSSLFRTHIGASMNNINAQIYDNKESLAHFRKFAMIYSQLSDYRFELMDIAVNNGQPLMMPMLAQYFYDPDILKLPDPPQQYLFGFEFIVSPSMTQGETSNRIYIPANADIIHLWSGNHIQTGQVGMWLTVPASLGFPNVFYQKNSIYGNDLRQFIIKNGFSEGYSWNYDDNIAKTNSNITVYIILSICILIFIVTAVIYRMKKSLFIKRAKYEKLSMSEILSPLAESDDEKISINY